MYPHVGEFESNRLTLDQSLPECLAREGVLVSIIETHTSQAQTITGNPEPLVIET